MFHGWPKIQDPFGWMPPEMHLPAIFQALAALAKVHLPQGHPFVSRTGGPSYELAAVYLACAILFLLLGPGRLSLDALLFGKPFGVKPHEKTNTVRTIMVHQILSERRFFAQFVGTREPPVEELLPPGDKPPVHAYIDKYVWLARLRLPQLAAATEEWWLTPMPFFGGLQRERIWTFWRRVLHTCNHRTQVQTWLRLAGRHVPAIYGPSGDVKWSEADPTYSVEAAKRGV